MERGFLTHLAGAGMVALAALAFVGHCSKEQERARLETWRQGYEAGQNSMIEERSGTAVEEPEAKGLTETDRQQRWSETFAHEAAIRDAKTEEERTAAMRRAQENREHWRLLEAAKNR